MKTIVLLIASVCFGGLLVAAEADVISVKGKGVGVDEAAALKDAYRDAVETAVGLYVDAEQLMKNDEVIKDQILTQSNAYIEGYKEISRTADNGLVTIKIVASVRTRTLAKRIEGVMPAKCVAVGSQLANIHAQSVTQETRGKDAVAIFKKELEELRKLRNLYEIELASPEGRPVERKERRVYRNGGYVAGQNDDDDIVEMDYLLRMTINSKRYFEEVVPRLDSVLSQIAIEEPKVVRYSVQDDSRKFPRCNQEKSYLTSGSATRDYGEKMCRFSLCHSVGEVVAPTPVGPYNRPVGPLRVSLIVFANEAMTVVRGKQYLLSEECTKAYLEWADVKKGYHPIRRQLPNALVSFLGSDGEPIAESEVKMVSENNTEDYLCECFKNRSWKITPWFGGDAKLYYRWFRFKLPKDDLPKIKSIKVELAN